MVFDLSEKGCPGHRMAAERCGRVVLAPGRRVLRYCGYGRLIPRPLSAVMRSADLRASLHDGSVTVSACQIHRPSSSSSADQSLSAASGLERRLRSRSWPVDAAVSFGFSPDCLWSAAFSASGSSDLASAAGSTCIRLSCPRLRARLLPASLRLPALRSPPALVRLPTRLGLQPQRLQPRRSSASGSSASAPRLRDSSASAPRPRPLRLQAPRLQPPTSASRLLGLRLLRLRALRPRALRLRVRPRALGFRLFSLGQPRLPTPRLRAPRLSDSSAFRLLGLSLLGLRLRSASGSTTSVSAASTVSAESAGLRRLVHEHRSGAASGGGGRSDSGEFLRRLEFWLGFARRQHNRCPASSRDPRGPSAPKRCKPRRR